MTTGEKISKIRKANNHTQEQLAELMGVSRQSISKWEANIAYPETEKLIKISKIYGCSLDYLLKDDIVSDNKDNNESMPIFNFEMLHYERKSKRCIKGIPLWHINIGKGMTAKGIVAIGFKAKGIISIGVMALGLISIGIFSIGILALGCLALGLISAGCFSAGIIAAGSISFGIIAFGAIAIGQFAIGALAIGNYVAIGDYAKGMFALGKSEAIGSIFQNVGKLTTEEKSKAIEMMKENIPIYFNWIRICISKLI